MKEFLLVAIGGGLGAVGRWKIGGWVLHRASETKFPLSTFTVNVIGCAIAGILAGVIVKHDAFTPATRTFLFTGVLGGFTTFSAFGLDTVHLLRRGEWTIALTYIVASVAVSVASLAIGMWAVAKS